MADGTWDCAIVGGGPAGLSAAVYMGRFRRRTVVVDAGDGRWSYGQRNDNYLGFPAGVSARRLRDLGRDQAGRFGVAFREATVTRVDRDRAGYRLATTGGPLRARTVIWAAGVRDRWPEFPGVLRLVGRRLFWCIVCDGWRTFERRVLLLGNSDQAAKTVLQFLTYTRKLTLLVDPAAGRLSAAAARKLETEGVAVRGGRIRHARLAGDGLAPVRLEDGTTVQADYIFSLFGSSPRTELLPLIGIALARNGHVRTDDKNRTNVPTFFAAGDVNDKHSHQVATAVAEGAQAAQAANFMLYPACQILEERAAPGSQEKPRLASAGQSPLS
jgi:thioredoxin reductase (NADPH)